MQTAGNARNILAEIVCDTLHCSDGGAERGSASWSGIRSDVLVISNSRRLNLGVRRTILYSLDVCRCVLVREIVLYRVDLTISLFRMFLGICVAT